MLRKVIIGIVALAVVIVGGLWAAATFFLDSATIADQVKKEVANRYNRELVFNGELRTNFFPKIQIVLPQTSLSFEGRKDPQFMLENASVGVAVMQGIKRGLFSNEAGMGSAPNAAATASVSHPVKQGLIQSLGVFTDTLLICTCTAFIILFSGAPLDGSVDGVQLTQQALTIEVGPVGEVFVAIAIFFFAFSSILGNYYYGEANIHFITKKRSVILVYRIAVAAFVLFGSLTTLQTAWSLADLMMALMTLCNLVAIVRLSPVAFTALKDYIRQKTEGQESPRFHKSSLLPDIRKDVELWD